MKAIEKANDYLMQLPPHVRARKAAKIIEKLVKELEAYKEVVDGVKSKLDSSLICHPAAVSFLIEEAIEQINKLNNDKK